MSSEGKSDGQQDGDDQEDGEDDDQDAVLDDPRRQQRRKKFTQIIGGRTNKDHPRSSWLIKRRLRRSGGAARCACLCVRVRARAWACATTRLFGSTSDSRGNEGCTRLSRCPREVLPAELTRLEWLSGLGAPSGGRA